MKWPQLPTPPCVARAAGRVVQVLAFRVGANPIVGMAMHPVATKAVAEAMVAAHFAPVIAVHPALCQLTPGGTPDPRAVQFVAANEAHASCANPRPLRRALLLNRWLLRGLRLLNLHRVLLQVGPYTRLQTRQLV